MKEKKSKVVEVMVCLTRLSVTNYKNLKILLLIKIF